MVTVTSNTSHPSDHNGGMVAMSPTQNRPRERGSILPLDTEIHLSDEQKEHLAALLRPMALDLQRRARTREGGPGGSHPKTPPGPA